MKKYSQAWSPIAFFLSAFIVGDSLLRADDWPQWRGTHRDARSDETGLLQEWPKGGPRQAWKALGFGRGYSSVAVADGKVFTMSDLGPPVNGEAIIALSVSSGKRLWTAKVGEPWNDGGPRCTPTVDGDLVYALSPHGDLVCVQVADGKVRWRTNLQREFGGHMMSGWGYSESPLVDGDKLICTPGGSQATLVALNKKTGKLIWKSPVPQGDGAAYSSVVAANVNGERQYIQFLGRGVVGVAAKDGKFLWRYDKPANGTANCSTCIVSDPFVFAASAYGAGGALAKISEADKADVVYSTKSMKNHHGGMVLVDGYLYGANGGNGETPALVCLDFKTGEVMWEERKAGKGSIAYADGRLYYRDEDGQMLLVEANPQKYVEHGRFNQPDRRGAPAWSHPALANGKLYLRDQDVLFCYDIKQP
ncbi:MAG TPA: PQQ-binding-like beta-propeller repeat protein [Gemmataceae bacterium]|jgi:outer membrane protein assembly factor BamB|nr:PQQ-binding-like beta-propeller repeat protein [Gemmataceae bacterium]